MPPSYSIEGIENRLARHAQRFDALLGTIPAKLYLPDGGATEDSEAKKSKQPQYPSWKRVGSEEAKEKAKAAKRAKLDPENHRTILEIQQQKVQESKASSDHAPATVLSKGKSKGKRSNGSDESSDQGGADDTASDLSLDQFGRPLPDFSDTMSDDEDREGQSGPACPMASASTDELQAKVKARIAELQASRGGSAKGVKDRARLAEQRKKRKESRKEAARLAREKAASGGKRVETILSEETNGKRGVSSKPGVKDARTIREDGIMSYGKVLLDGEVTKARKTQAVHALKKLEEKKEKTAALMSKNPEKASQVLEKERWRKAVAMAEGEKPKDDEALLRRAIKRTEGEKRKSSKEWSDRKKTISMAQKKKADKRNENIKARIDEVKARKMNGGKKVKKPAGASKKARPGFEGKNTGKSGGPAKSKSKGRK
ncbi:surfeit locus protein 6-domain-containing protein [Piptocephalis cylindrospora]|uniref:Surfeit locus protein 6-domain-containing protein n=1 Tax=Piptocephalis cylindrospora TaxID=1907219 RepID=A0A4P9Y5E5_9FUNG|nr:surfeit locus protein 6-domain-containing protein [Piptocephalis cylindrospora]|eukprot:RKP14226.1 surfeit locus protein 6-domain-containing protein [Piptocephalis cylindrospora]